MRLTPMRKNATNVGNSTTPAAGTGEKKPLSLSKNAIKCRKKRVKKAEEKKLEKEEAACHGELQLAKLANQKKRLQASLLREVDDNSATSLGAPWNMEVLRNVLSDVEFETNKICYFSRAGAENDETDSACLAS